jgi:hypothetical protein
MFRTLRTEKSYRPALNAAFNSRQICLRFQQDDGQEDGGQKHQSHSPFRLTARSSAKIRHLSARQLSAKWPKVILQAECRNPREDANPSRIQPFSPMRHANRQSSCPKKQLPF